MWVGGDLGGVGGDVDEGKVGVGGDVGWGKVGVGGGEVGM